MTTERTMKPALATEIQRIANDRATLQVRLDEAVDAGDFVKVANLSKKIAEADALADHARAAQQRLAEKSRELQREQEIAEGRAGIERVEAEGPELVELAGRFDAEIMKAGETFQALQTEEERMRRGLIDSASKIDGGAKSRLYLELGHQQFNTLNAFRARLRNIDDFNFMALFSAKVAGDSVPLAKVAQHDFDALLRAAKAVQP